VKKYAKVLQADARGQIVIPKEVRDALGIDEGTAFFAYLIEGEGLFLKRIAEPDPSQSAGLREIKDKARKIGVNSANVEKSQKEYKRGPRGGLSDV
jgi:AbrB family looped-hinge helix DNA binding protein